MAHPHNLLAVIVAAGQEYQCTPAEIVGPSRAANVCAARRAVCRVARGNIVSRSVDGRDVCGDTERWGMSLDAIARRIGRKHPGEVLSMLRPVHRTLDAEAAARAESLPGCGPNEYGERLRRIREAASQAFDWMGFCGLSWPDPHTNLPEDAWGVTVDGVSA